MPSISPIYYILFSNIVIILIFSYIIFGSYTRKIDAIGEVVIIPYPIILVSTKSGYIKEVFVKKGQEVHVRDNLFSVSDNQFTNDINQDIYTLELKNLKKQIQNTKEYIISLDNQSKSLKNLLENIKQLKNSYKSLLSTKAVSKQEYLNQLNYLEIKNQEYQNLLKEKNLMLIRLQELENIILNKKYDKYHLIKSPVHGFIESVDVTKNQSISLNRHLGSIKPFKEDLKIIFWVPNDAIPYINESDIVKIRYLAFPFEKFGQFKGIVSSISTVPASTSQIALYKNNIDIQMNPNNPLYKVEVKIDKPFILVKNKRFDFFNGMQSEATFFLEKRKIYQWIFSSIFK